MSERYPTSTDDERERAVTAASLAIQRGGLVILPTDTVYGIAADAFDADAVEALLDAKERGRDMPVPVLVSSAMTLDALAVKVPDYARALVEEFWPGPLTLVCHQQSSLKWDLGDTRGTVALRMPEHEITLAVLERTGPLAVSSANLSGRPAATTAEQAETMLGDEVDVVVDAGPSSSSVSSTIVDATGATPKVLRLGALDRARLLQVLSPLGVSLEGLAGDAEVEPEVAPEAVEEPAGEPGPEPATTSWEAVPDLTSPYLMDIADPPSTDPVVTPVEELPEDHAPRDPEPDDPEPDDPEPDDPEPDDPEPGPVR